MLSNDNILGDDLSLDFRSFAPPVPVLPYEPETTDTLTAAGIPNDASATIYTGRTGADIWTQFDARMVAIKGILGLPLKVANLGTVSPVWYFAIGNTAASQTFNTSLDPAYNGTAFGGYTFDASGATPNGSNGYISTAMQLSVLPQNSMSILIKLTTDQSGLHCDVSAQGDQATTGMLLLFPNVSGNLGTALTSIDGVFITGSTGDKTFVLSRTNASEYDIYIDGTYFDTIAEASLPPTNDVVVISRDQRFGGAFYSNKTWTGFAAFSVGLTALQAAGISTELQTLDTYLGR